MARKAEATLWMLVKIGERSVMKRLVKKGRGYVPKVEGAYEPGSYYLRYRQHGKRTWESVGSDLTIALQEKKARQKALETPAVPVSVTALPKRNLREAVTEFVNGKDNKNWCHILTVFGDWWSWEKHVEDFQRPDFKAFAKHMASLSLRPRTQDNYLRNVCTFFRAAGRVVEIVRNEQDATLAARKTTLTNTLFLVSRDFPTVNKGMADYYSDAQIEGLFAGAVNLWERLMLSMFYYTGMREAEVSHLYWSNVNWEAEEIEVKEKPEWDWTSKSSVDRMVEAPPQLMEVLREAYAGRGTSKLIFPNQLNHPEGQEFGPAWRLSRSHDGRDSTIARVDVLPSTGLAESLGSRCMGGNLAFNPARRRNSSQATGKPEVILADPIRAITSSLAVRERLQKG